MTDEHEPSEAEGRSDELSDRVDDALSRLWRGDAAPIDELLSALDGAGPSVGGIVAGLSRSAGLPDSPSGGTIGPYEIVRELGRGAMGIVFEARRHAPDRTVALKLLRGGPFIDDYHVRLYEREIQTLAQLNHPNIAALYEAGTTADGARYFAMELVRGTRLDQLAGDRRTRLQCFVEICRAIAHAHQRGVIHRDLKPSNIIINESGRPKVLDFGLARLLDTAGVPVIDTLVVPGHLVGTLAYVSPEQAQGDGDAVDIRTDVYSLGVLLYQLMTGRLPHDLERRPLTDAIRVIVEETPPAPGTVDRTLRGDLETIILAAMEKDPARRYDSAAALADDVVRVLDSQPIRARPPRAWYVAGKFFRRHRAISLVVAGLLLALVAGTVGTSWGLLHARARARDAVRANEHAQRVTAFLQRVMARPQDAVASSVYAMTSRSPRQRSTVDVTMNDVLAWAEEESAHEFADDPDVLVEVWRTLGRSYLALSDRSAATSLLTRADALALDAFGPTDPRTLACRLDLVDALRVDSRMDAAAAIAQEVHAICLETLPPHDPVAIDAALAVATGCVATHQLDLAASLVTDAVDAARAAHGPSAPPTLRAVRHLVSIRLIQSREEDAVDLLYELIDARAGAEGHELELLRDRSELGAVLLEIDRIDEVIDVMTPTVVQWRERHGPDDPESLDAATTLAAALGAAGRLDDAERLARDTYALQLQRFGPDHPQTIRGLRAVGRTLVRRREAGRPASSALGPPVPLSHGATTELFVAVAGANAASGGHETALEMYEELEAIATTDDGPLHPLAVEARIARGLELAALDRIEEAIAVLVSAWSPALTVFGDDARVHLLAATLVELLDDAGRWDEADEYRGM